MSIAFEIASMKQDYYLGCIPVNNFGPWTQENQGYMLEPMTIAKRIQERMDELGYTQDVLATRAGVSQTTVYKLTSGKAKESRKIMQIADALGVEAKWLQYGTKPKIGGRHGYRLPSNFEPGPEITGMIPLISWVQAGQFCTSPDLFHPGDAEEWLPAVKKFGPHAYALRVVGDSMVLPYPSKDSFFPGTIIFVDPDKPLTNGAKVIAKIKGTEEATFKVYSEDGGKRYLKPHNPQYPVIEMDETMQICGVVVWQGGDV